MGSRPSRLGIRAPTISVTRPMAVREVGCELKRQVDAGQDIDILPLIEWVIEAASKTATETNRHLVELPDRFAVARWSRDADEATIARCILATLKFEPHASDTARLRQALESVAL